MITTHRASAGQDPSGAERAQKRVLMVAYHFPPLAGSSGIQRTLRFVQHLPARGWEPMVLSAHPRAYERTNDDLERDIPASTVVRRAAAWDTARHLSVYGRYPMAWALPDRWCSWRFDAIRQGLRMVREFKPAAVWSTYPIATAHLIGAEIARRAGLPWIADFRDPMAQVGYPSDARMRASFERIESVAMSQAAFCTFTTPGCLRMYRDRYPDARATLTLLENGYDESTFGAIQPPPTPAAGPKVLLHSGIVYPSERDPTQLMHALRLLHERGAITPSGLQLRFRAAVHTTMLLDLAARFQVEPYVEVAPPVGYREALQEMVSVDGLLLLQAANCNDQIPAKVYEYFRSRRPVVALTDPSGDTAALLARAGISDIARLDDAGDIAELLERFATGSTERLVPTDSAVSGASREARSAELAALLDRASSRADRGNRRGAGT